MSTEDPTGGAAPHRQVQVAPFGSWSSPLAVADVAAGKVSRSGLQGAGDWFYWSESRPTDGGRQVVVRAGGGGPAGDEGRVEEVSPPAVSVRSRLHEYGGGAATVAGGLLLFVDQADQRIYRSEVGHGGPAVPLTPPTEPAVGVSCRFADGRVTPSGRWLVGIEERVAAGGTTHRVAAVATDGSERVISLVADRHFVAAPRPSPDGRWLAWTAWDRPHMPWDQSEVWIGALHDDRDGASVTQSRRVGGGDGVSVGQPLWCRDGSLVFVDDRTGWWLPYRVAGSSGYVGSGARAMVAVEAEFHAPDWVVGQSTLAELADGSLVGRMHHDGRDHLVRLRPPEAAHRSAPGRRFAPDRPGRWTIEPVSQPCVTIAGVAAAAGGTRLAVLGATPTVASAVYEVDVDGSGRWRPLSAAPTSVMAVPGVAEARPFVATTEAGPVPGLFYAPTSVTTEGPPGERPPLVVFCHGGPTGAAEPGFDPIVQLLTSRGMAVAAVDYRGSSGYGRAYRQQLQGLWGEADVDDCVAYAVALAEGGWIDGARMAIRGTSAGGLTALGALVRSDRFAGAVAWYGVTDLEALAADTHDFEARYLDGLVGPLPEAAARYRRRSPVHHPTSVSGAVLLMQGADDPVVPAAQSERFAEALAACGVPCHLRVFPGESHGFRRASTIDACLRAELAFYRALFGLDPAGERPGAGVPSLLPHVKSSGSGDSLPHLKPPDCRGG